MRLSLDLFKLNKIDWHKLTSWLTEEPEPTPSDFAERSQNNLSRRPRTTSHYNLSTIYKAMDMSA